MIETIVDREDENFVYGHSEEDGVFVTDWVVYKKDMWFSKPIKSILDGFGFDLDPKRCEEIEYIIDGDISGLYYVSLLNDEAIKWFLGAVMAESKISGKHYSKIIDAYTLQVFGEYITTGKIDRAFAKDIFRDLIDNEPPLVFDVSIDEFDKYGYDYNYCFGVRKRPDHIFDDLLKDPKYKLIGGSEIDDIIEKVINDNLEQFERAKKDEKLINWFVGQCMKAGKGKLSAQVVKDKILERM